MKTANFSTAPIDVAFWLHCRAANLASGDGRCLVTAQCGAGVATVSEDLAEEQRLRTARFTLLRMSIRTRL